jgi:hypothetical protein
VFQFPLGASALVSRFAVRDALAASRAGRSEDK